MITRGLSAPTAVLTLLCVLLGASAAVPGTAGAKETFTFVYLRLEEDPAYAPRRAYTGLRLRDSKPPLEGARVAIRESRILGRSLGIKIALQEESLTLQTEVAAAIKDIAAQAGAGVFLLDLPLEAVKSAGTALAGENLILFNLRHRDDSLRGADCSPILFHSLPSRAMLMDGLAQHLVRKSWRRVLILEGESEEDRTLSLAFQGSARKFGLDVVEKKSFVLSNDPRQRDKNNIALLTTGPDHDVVFLADVLGEFGRYVPYQTQRPRPVVGNEGLVASAWHWTWERHGAPQLNQRFDKRAGRHMTGTDWAAWAAVRSVVEAIAKGKSLDITELRRRLTAPDFTLDTYKGAPGSYRSWDRQLRQPILLHTHNAVIARAPVDGFLHQHNLLDTLGADRGESGCRPG